MAKKEIVAPIVGLEDLIHEIREQKIILDADLARIYGVATKRLNEQVKRNRERFPADFTFQLTAKESAAILRPVHRKRLSLRKVRRAGRKLRPAPRNIVIHVCALTPSPNTVRSWPRMS